MRHLMISTVRSFVDGGNNGLDGVSADCLAAELLKFNICAGHTTECSGEGQRVCYIYRVQGGIPVLSSRR